MTSYTPLDVVISAPDRQQRLWVCSSCGSVVGRNDQGRHTAWHVKLEQLTGR